jgi:hypothetical protein
MGDSLFVRRRSIIYHKATRFLPLLGLVAALLLGVALAIRVQDVPTENQQDIYYSYVEGQRILNGENPYARVLASDMRTNDKYANYFPFFYELSALSILAGLREYPAWIAFWRVPLSVAGLAVGVAMFWVLYRRRLYAAAVFAVLLWFGNRWTIRMFEIADLEFVSLFFIILSLELYKKHRWASLLLFSLSLAVKHIGVFMVPVFLIWSWHGSPTVRGRVKEVTIAALAIASIPLITSVPFILWNAEALAKSIIFEATREPAGPQAVHALIGWDGLLKRLPLLGMLISIWFLVWKRKIGNYTSALFVQASLVAVNPVFFDSYVTWFFPVIPLVVADFSDAASRQDRMAGDPELERPGAS